MSRECGSRAVAMGLENPIAPDVILEATSAGGVKAEWATTPNADASRAVLYIHGGGCVTGSLDSHRHAVAEMGRAASARMLALDYRFAPESPFPAQIDDCLEAYRHLLGTGFRPQNLSLAGDSAGGGLAIATLMAIRDAGLPRPACGWAISPWVVMESGGGSMLTKAAEDPVVQKPLSEFMAKTFRNPLALPIYGDLRGLPPLLIQVGAAETLLDDSVRLASVAGAAHVPVTLEIWPDMVHIWHVYFRHLTAARKAIVQGGAFVRTAMDGNHPIPHGVG
jgi:epsilon-lactone hydrolase